MLMVQAACLPSEDGCWGIKQFYSCLQPLYPHSLLGKKFSNMVSNFLNNGSFRDTEIRLLVAKGERAGGRMEWEVGVSRCKLLYVEWIKNKVWLPRWLSSKESTCQCRRHGFHPWSRKIPHATEQLSLCATTTEPVPWSPSVATTEVRVLSSLSSATREALSAS